METVQSPGGPAGKTLFRSSPAPGDYQAAAAMLSRVGMVAGGRVMWRTLAMPFSRFCASLAALSQSSQGAIIFACRIIAIV